MDVVVQPPPNGERKFWQGPIKHASWGASAMAAVLWLTPMKRIFYTREEGAANSAQIEEIKVLITTGFASQKADLFAHAADESHKHERIVDNYRKEIGDEKSDRIHDDDQTNKRIDLVMELFKIKHTKTN